MSVRLGLFAFALLGVAATPAIAQSCGSDPIAPAIPSVAEIKQKAPADAAASKHDAFVEIKNWQADLKTYRACLTNIGNGDKRQLSQLDASKDASKVKQLKDEAAGASHAFDESVDMEERVANEFHAIQTAYCARADVDRSSCPK
ncbi:MAG TPA: hypothetical protein VGG69_04400 [Rhizomicrobium sp.]|jgi:hypothetical protein